MVGPAPHRHARPEHPRLAAHHRYPQRAPVGLRAARQEGAREVRVLDAVGLAIDAVEGVTAAVAEAEVEVAPGDARRDRVCRGTSENPSHAAQAVPPVRRATTPRTTAVRRWRAVVTALNP